MNKKPNCLKCGDALYVQSSYEGEYLCRGCGLVFNSHMAVKTDQQPTLYPTLDPDFLKLMSEIGMYGLEKYKDESLEARFKRGDFSRTDRTKSREIAKHVANHFGEYLDGVVHDKFGTRRHQLAAVAFNAMMEFTLSANGEVG